MVFLEKKMLRLLMGSMKVSIGHINSAMNVNILLIVATSKLIRKKISAKKIL